MKIPADHKQFFILFVVICVIVLAISVYKVYRFYKKEDNKQKLQEFFENNKKLQDVPFIKRMNTIRNGIIIGFSILMLLSIVFINIFDVANPIPGIIIFSLSVGMIWLKSVVVAKLWRCPYCLKYLPTRAGRAGARPVMTATCPFCGKDFCKKTDTTK